MLIKFKFYRLKAQRLNESHVEENGLKDDDDENEGKNEESKKKKKKNKNKKKKHNKEGLQQKKQDKMFALEGQFQGLEMPSFSGVELTDNQNFATSTNEVEKNGTKRKAQDGDAKAKKKKKKSK